MSELLRSARELMVLLGFISSFGTVRSGAQRGLNKLPVYTWELYKTGQIIWNGGKCKEYESLVIGVSTAAGNRVARDMVRRTWGRHCARLGVRVIFVIGNDHGFTSGYEYDDIVVGPFKESYRNLTLKTLSMFEWAITYCPRARWFLKTDDDVFLFVVNILSFIAHLEHDNCIWGNMYMNEKVARNKRRKNHVDMVQYPEEVFPPYTTGSAYLVPMWAAGWLLKEARRVPYVSTEDAFLTGIVAQRLGIPRNHSNLFSIPLGDITRGIYRQEAIAVHLGRKKSKLCELWYNQTDAYTDYRLFRLLRCSLLPKNVIKQGIHDNFEDDSETADDEYLSLDEIKASRLEATKHDSSHEDGS